MTDAPEKKWLTPNGGLPTGNGWHESELVEYTRTDIADEREAEQVQWVKDLADTVIAHETRIAELEAALITTRALVCEGATVGFNFADGDWADRLYQNNGNISNTLRGHETGGVDNNGAADAILAALPELTASLSTARNDALDESVKVCNRGDIINANSAALHITALKTTPPAGADT